MDIIMHARESERDTTDKKEQWEMLMVVVANM